jgi:hypothetical protein
MDLSLTFQDNQTGHKDIVLLSAIRASASLANVHE